MARPEVSREVLENGLTVLLCETRVAPVAEFQIWACAGAADERDDERGVAHFHEHMLFKGTGRRGVGEIAGEIEGAGGRINAYTSFDVTVYHTTMPSDRIDVGIDVLCDAVLHSSFDPAELEREIQVVLEEIRRSEDSPGSVLGNALFAEAYKVHAYGSPILGSPESVGGFDRAQVRGFYQRWYCPSNLVVTAVGDFDRQHVLARVREAFEGVPTGTAQRQRAPEPRQKGLRTSLLARPFERTQVELAWPTVALSHPDAPYLDLLAYLLGNGDSSRLVRRVKEQAGLVDRIDAYSYTPLDPGMSSIDIETDAERVGDAISACVAEVETLRAVAVSEDELEKARVNFVASEHFERESVAGLAAKLGGFQTTGGGYELEQRYLETVRTATPADLLRVAQEHLDAKHLTVAAVLPEADAAALDETKVATCIERAQSDTRLALAVPRASERSSTGLATYTLGGGATLHVLPRRSLPIVAARAAFLGGLLAEEPDSSGLSAFTTSMWLRGTANHSAAGFARAVESRAVEIDSFTGRSSFGLTLETPSESLQPAFDLFCEVLCAPAFDAGEIERERRDTLAAIERREDRLAQRAFLLFAQNQFRSHPYRMPTLGSKQVVEGIGREQLIAQHERFTVQENLVLAVVGDVDPDAVARDIGARLAELPPGPFTQPNPPLEAAPTEIRRAELRKDRAQAHLVIGFRGVSLDDDDRFALEVIAQLLAGQGGRLFLELRDKRALAYSVSASSVEGLAPGYFVTYIATAPERLDEARSGLLEELARVIEAPPEAGELERARRYLTGNFAIDQQRNAVHAAEIALGDRYGLGPESHLEYAERIGAISAKDVLRVARRIVDLSAYTEAVVLP